MAVDPLNHIIELPIAHGLLSSVRGCTLMIRTSLYVDDAAIFMVPTKDDIFNLAAILHRKEYTGGGQIKLVKGVSSFQSKNK
jgi:hypothetical protein